MSLTIYSLINPSDDLDFEAADDAVAEAVVALVGDMYGWERTDPETGETVSGGLLGMKAMGGTDMTADLDALKATVGSRRSEVADALDSLEIQGARRRRLGADREAWADEHRSSMNDIASYAWSIAASLRKQEVSA